MVINLERWRPFPNLLYRAEAWLAGISEEGDPESLKAAWEREIFAIRPLENSPDRLRGPEEVCWKAMYAMVQVTQNFGGKWVKENFFMQDSDLVNQVALKNFIEAFEDSLSRRKAPRSPGGSFEIIRIPLPPDVKGKDVPPHAITKDVVFYG